MFAEQTVYVNELHLTHVLGLERRTYCFNAHATEHVEKILCCNISRWALGVWATSQASYCRIDHTDPHLQKHIHTPKHIQGHCSGSTVQELQSMLCRVVLLCFTRVFQLFGKTRGLMARGRGGSLFILLGFNYQYDIIMALLIWCRQSWKVFAILLLICVSRALFFPDTKSFTYCHKGMWKEICIILLAQDVCALGAENS